MALTKISSNEIQPAAITSDLISADVSLGVKISNVSIANSTYTVLDDTAVNVGGGYIVITGAGFNSGAQVIIGGTNATSVTRVSSTELRAEVPAKSAATYNVYVVNTDGSTGIRVNGLTYSATPTWVTGSTLDNWTVDTATNITFNASGATSYSNTTALPTGTTLLSNGYFYGTITGIESETTYSFTVRAIDAEAQDSDRTFSLTVSTVTPLTFNISPAVSGKSTWDLSVDGALTLDTAGTWTITPTSSSTCATKIWGAGGGGATFWLTGTQTRGPGGAGGAAVGTVSFESGVDYVLRVGQGGRGAIENDDTFTAAAGGGRSGTYDGNWGTGSGGAYSGIFRTSESQANAVIIAGGGGGGGIVRDSAGQSVGGGAGGGTSGQDGYNKGDTINNAKGATQGAGGAGQVTTGGLGTAQSGSSLTGGTTTVTPGNGRMGAGGGSGYYGGGSSTYYFSSPNEIIGGAGGGSGYYNATYVSGATLYTGSGTTAGNSADSDRGTAGNAGVGTQPTGAATNLPAATVGQPGKIILYLAA
jgi:hypothetical protein